MSLEYNTETELAGENATTSMSMSILNYVKIKSLENCCENNHILKFLKIPKCYALFKGDLFFSKT